MRPFPRDPTSLALREYPLVLAPSLLLPRTIAESLTVAELTSVASIIVTLSDLTHGERDDDRAAARD